MANQDVLSFVRMHLEEGESNEVIVQGLREQFQIDVSHRTLQRWIKKEGFQRTVPKLAFNRSVEWIEDVRALIKRNRILYHLRKSYNEDISLRTFQRVLQVRIELF
jgi:hypothetical protein